MADGGLGLFGLAQHDNRAVIEVLAGIGHSEPS
jgi:hypothetical protein